MTSATNSSVKTTAIWILRVLMAALFGFAAFAKLSGNPMMVAEFEQLGIGQWCRYLTGGLELLGVVAVLVPSVSLLGAVLLLAVDAGAFVAQIGILHGDWIHTVVIGAILAALVYLQRERLPFALR